MIPLVLLIAAGAFLYSRSSRASGGTSSSPVGPTPPSEPDLETGNPKYDRFNDLWAKYCPAYGVPVLWAKAFCLNESDMGDNPLVQAGELSEDGLSKGIMQLTLETANDYETVTLDDLNDPETSIRIACKLIRDIRSAFEPSEPRYVEWCVKSYNRGIARTRQERDLDPRGLAEPGFSNGETYWARWQRNYSRLGGTL